MGNEKPGFTTGLFCAEGGSRTHTPVKELRPERSASANSAISAIELNESYHLIRPPVKGIFHFGGIIGNQAMLI